MCEHTRTHTFGQSHRVKVPAIELFTEGLKVSMSYRLLWRRTNAGAGDGLINNDASLPSEEEEEASLAPKEALRGPAAAGGGGSTSAADADVSADHTHSNVAAAGEEEEEVSYAVAADTAPAVPPEQPAAASHSPPSSQIAKQQQQNPSLPSLPPGALPLHAELFEAKGRAAIALDERLSFAFAGSLWSDQLATVPDLAPLLLLKQQQEQRMGGHPHAADNNNSITNTNTTNAIYGDVPDIALLDATARGGGGDDDALPLGPIAAAVVAPTVAAGGVVLAPLLSHRSHATHTTNDSNSNDASFNLNSQSRNGPAASSAASASFLLQRHLSNASAVSGGGAMSRSGRSFKRSKSQHRSMMSGGGDSFAHSEQSRHRRAMRWEEARVAAQLDFLSDEAAARAALRSAEGAAFALITLVDFYDPYLCGDGGEERGGEGGASRNDGEDSNAVVGGRYPPILEYGFAVAADAAAEAERSQQQCQPLVDEAAHLLMGAARGSGGAAVAALLSSTAPAASTTAASSGAVALPTGTSLSPPAPCSPSSPQATAAGAGHRLLRRHDTAAQLLRDRRAAEARRLLGIANRGLCICWVSEFEQRADIFFEQRREWRQLIASCSPFSSYFSRRAGLFESSAAMLERTAELSARWLAEHDGLVAAATRRSHVDLGRLLSRQRAELLLHVAAWVPNLAARERTERARIVAFFHPFFFPYSGPHRTAVLAEWFLRWQRLAERRLRRKRQRTAVAVLAGSVRLETAKTFWGKWALAAAEGSVLNKLSVVRLSAEDSLRLRYFDTLRHFAERCALRREQRRRAIALRSNALTEIASRYLSKWRRHNRSAPNRARVTEMMADNSNIIRRRYLFDILINGFLRMRRQQRAAAAAEADLRLYRLAARNNAAVSGRYFADWAVWAAPFGAARAAEAAEAAAAEEAALMVIVRREMADDVARLQRLALADSAGTAAAAFGHDVVNAAAVEGDDGGRASAAVPEAAIVADAEDIDDPSLIRCAPYAHPRRVFGSVAATTGDGGANNEAIGAASAEEAKGPLGSTEEGRSNSGEPSGSAATPLPTPAELPSTDFADQPNAVTPASRPLTSASASTSQTALDGGDSPAAVRGRAGLQPLFVPIRKRRQREREERGERVEEQPEPALVAEGRQAEAKAVAFKE